MTEPDMPPRQTAAVRAPIAARPPRPSLTLARMAPAVFLGATFLATAYATWGRFGEVVVDTGRELDVPRRLLLGERLHADVRWYYGPLAPWVNTQLYRWFGVHVDVLSVAGLTSAALLATVIYLLARRFAGRLAATGATLAFLWLGAFGNVCGFAICNFVLPYTFAATYGMLAAAASLLLLVRHAQTGRGVDFAGSAALLAVAALAKLEPLAPAVAAHCAFALAAVWDRRLRLLHVAGWASAVAFVAACLGYLAASTNGAVWTDLRALANPGSRPFIAFSMGVDRLGVSASRALVSGAALAGVVVVAAAASWGANRATRPLVSRAILGAAGGVVAAGYFALGAEDAFRALPMAMAVMLVILARRWVLEPEARGETLPAMLLWVFGFVALGRIVFRVNLDTYGFYLLPVGLVCVAVLVSEDLPRMLRAGAPGRTAFALAALAICSGAGLETLRATIRENERRVVAVESPRGTLRLPESQTGVAEMVRSLSALSPSARLLVIPEGAGVNFLSGLAPADAMSSHLPMEIPDDDADRRLLDALRGRPPDLVLVIAREMAEFGYQGFGRDYALRTAAWLSREYRPIYATHPGVVLLKHGTTDVPMQPDPATAR